MLWMREFIEEQGWGSWCALEETLQGDNRWSAQMEITDSIWKSKGRNKKLGWWVNLLGNLWIVWVRVWLISMPAADVVLWLPTFFTEFLVPLAGSGLSNAGEWNPLPNSFKHPLPFGESKRSSGHRAMSGRAGRRVGEAKRGSGRLQELWEPPLAGAGSPGNGCLDKVRRVWCVAAGAGWWER